MKLSYYKINPTGNITLIVETPVPRESQAAVASALSERDKTVEQVGFLEIPRSSCAAARLQMMGGEFCGNASISTAAVILSEVGFESYTLPLEVSGIDGNISVTVSRNADGSFTGNVEMPVPEAIYDYTFLNGLESYTFPLVRVPGICHAIINKRFSPALAETLIADWCRQLSTEALGLMFLNESAKTMEPLVYVASTNTKVWENSCASGTAASAAYLAKLRCRDASVSLRQPGGTLSAEARFLNNAVRSIRLSGSAIIEGKFEIELNT